MRIRFLCTCLSFFVASPLIAQDGPSKEKPMRVGIIGLDTSHVPAFTKLMNHPEAKGDLAKVEVVAAFPGGSPDIASSRDRVEGFTNQLREMKVEICESIEKLISKVDAVLIESVDGRPHLEQAYPVIQAGLPIFIDKPLEEAWPTVSPSRRLPKKRRFDGSVVLRSVFLRASFVIVIPLGKARSLGRLPGALARSNQRTQTFFGTAFTAWNRSIPRWVPVAKQSLVRITKGPMW